MLSFKNQKPDILLFDHGQMPLFCWKNFQKDVTSKFSRRLLLPHLLPQPESVYMTLVSLGSSELADGNEVEYYWLYYSMTTLLLFLQHGMRYSWMNQLIHHDSLELRILFS